MNRFHCSLCRCRIRIDLGNGGKEYVRHGDKSIEHKHKKPYRLIEEDPNYPDPYYGDMRNGR